MRNNLLLTTCALLAVAPGIKAQYARPAITKGVTLEQKLNSQVPLDVFFNDEAGRSVPLRTYFGDKPVVLELVYFKCPSLCPMTIHESVSSLRRVPLEPGKDYDVVVVSFDPADTPVEAAEVKAGYAKEFGRTGFDAGWHFLTGKQEDISKLTSAVGFRYRWDERTHQFIHAGGIMVATPEGKLSRYFYGIQYAPADLRMALVEAASHKIGSPVDYVLLFCFHWDPSQGKYTLTILNVLKVAGAITLFVLLGLIYLLMRNDGRRPEWKGRHAG